jgi:hypothetical protein
VLILGLAALAALYLGFVCFDAKQCQWLVRHFAYGWIFALFAAAIAAAILLLRQGSFRWRAAWPGRTPALLIFAAWLWVLRMDPFGYKILYDEPVQISTSFTLHQERELATTVRAYYIDGLYTVLKVYLDKRPPFFPFVVAALHDLTGYRMANAYVANAGATLLLLALTWHFGRRLGGGPAGGAWAVGLLGTLPILGVMATGAGMDLLNLTMLAAFACAGLAFLQQPGSAPRACLFVVVTALLGYTRYESVLYVVSAGLVWCWACWRERRLVHVGWFALLPLTLVLYGWHNTVLSESPELWELGENQTRRFSFEYAPNNLRHAVQFLFNRHWALPNSLLLTGAGLAGGILVAARALARRSAVPPAARVVLGATAVSVVANFAVLMCYYWGELDDPIVTRLALPLHLLLSWSAAAGWVEWRALAGARWGGWRIPAISTAAALLLWTIPTMAQRRYAMNLGARNLEWEHRIVSRIWPRPDLIITSRAPVCWLAERQPAIGFERARGREADLRWHLAHQSFGEVFVMQRVLTLGAGGGWAVDASDRLPESWKLQTLAVRRVGVTLTRISRVTAIDAPASHRDPNPAEIDANHTAAAGDGISGATMARSLRSP